jgi:hypothetical protein
MRRAPHARSRDARRAPRHLRIFLSSPGDVEAERRHAETVIGELPYEPGLQDKVTLQAVAWDRPGARVPMHADKPAQRSVDLALGKPSECDIVVAIIAGTLGTAMEQPQYAKPDGAGFYTGTEWELEEARQVEPRPAMLIYRRTRLELDSTDAQGRRHLMDELERVDEFFDRCRARDGAIANSYATPGELRERLTQDLKREIFRILEAGGGQAEPGGEPQPRWQGSPYLGLTAYGPEHAPIYFGRGAETDDLLSLLGESGLRFIAVVGASGSGKSSLVAAGLLPSLARGALAGSETWMWVRFKPSDGGQDPFLALAYGLAEKLPGERWRGREPQLAGELRSGELGWPALVNDILQEKPVQAELLCFVDQFEELFTHSRPEHQASFIALLALAARTPRLRVVLTLRADFYGRAVEHSALIGLLRERGTYPLDPPGVGALHQMIVRPAQCSGLAIDERLTQRILDDTGTDPGALALMAFTLRSLYEKDETRRRLTEVDYDALGRVQGAIGREAEGVVGRLDAAAREALGEIFRELVHIDAGGGETRKRAPRAALDRSALAARLADALIEARLLVAWTDKDGVPVVEVAHEVLLRSWPTLASWIRDSRSDLLLRQKLTSDAREWQEKGFPEGTRWSDERAMEVGGALRRLGIASPALEGFERAFLGPVDRRDLLAALGDPAADHHQRGRLGVRLDLLGDTRPGVGLREDGLPDLVWCAVPGGRVVLEDGAGEFEVEPFHIARYPITYRQYRAFLEASDGYQSRDWWEGLKGPFSDPERQAERRDNHPAEGMVWYEALTYCRWLSARLGYEVRLPTEWEWQQAASGGDPENAYPWGPDWVEERANTFEARLNRSTAVGMYPEGASPVAALDLAGNVWEWCLNEYDDPAQTGIGGEARRVVRGGSWGDLLEDARCAYRVHDHPGVRDDDLGFRVVCVSPIP